MQRKALKQLGKVTQWTNEKVFSGEKTQLSSDFTEFERDIDVKRKGIERLHATSQPFFEQLTKLKPTADPYPPGSGKDKILYTEALGLVMIDYGGDLKNAYGDGLAKYGRARCKLAIVQEEYGNRLREGYIAGMESSLEAVNEYKAFRKKLDSRRLALDAAINKLNGAKKDHDKLEFEVQNARERFEEIEEETSARMEVIQAGEEAEFEGLSDLLEAELAYFTQCKEVLEDLKASWPSGAPTGRPRSGTTTSTRSIKQPRRSAAVSSDDEPTPNRSRSQSNASGSGRTEKRKSMLPSFGSFGKKAGSSFGGIASMGGGGSKRREKERRAYGDDEHAALNSDEDDDQNGYYAPQLSPRAQFASSGRTRSTSTLSTIHQPITEEASFGPAPPVLRRTYTSPSGSGAKYVKALYDFPGEGHDELTIRSGAVIEVKQEVSSDWWIGEIDGRSGMFPSSYTEEYVPSPVVAVPPPMPRRNMPPSGSNGMSDVLSRSTPPQQRNAYLPPSPTLDYQLTSDSELSQGWDDADHYATASLATSGQPAAQARTASTMMPLAPAMSTSSSTSGSGKKAPPPPPPTSRRSQSSTNLSVFGNGPPPPPASRSRASTITRQQQQYRNGSSPEGSPFGGPSPFANSEDEESDAPSQVSAANSQGSGTRPAAGARGLSSGLGAMHLQPTDEDGASGAARECGQCDCRDFTQNVFKAKGTCSTCFHQH